MQLEADAKLAEEMQREEEAAQARASRLLAYGDVAVGSNVMEGILEKKPVRGFGRSSAALRAGEDCAAADGLAIAIIEWHHGDGDDTGGTAGCRWPTETRVREGAAGDDDALFDGGGRGGRGSSCRRRRGGARRVGARDGAAAPRRRV